MIRDYKSSIKSSHLFTVIRVWEWNCGCYVVFNADCDDIVYDNYNYYWCYDYDDDKNDSAIDDYENIIMVIQSKRNCNKPV